MIQFKVLTTLPILFAGSLESANSSILAPRRLFKEVVGEKNQDFMLIRLFNPNDLIGCGGDINQSKSVPMMSLNVVGNIDQSNFRCLRGSPWVVSMGLHEWSPWVSTGGLCGSPQVSMGGLCGWFGG